MGATDIAIKEHHDKVKGLVEQIDIEIANHLKVVEELNKQRAEYVPYLTEYDKSDYDTILRPIAKPIDVDIEKVI